MLTPREAASEAELLRKTKGPSGPNLSRDDVADLFEALGVDPEEMIAVLTEISLTFGAYAEVDQPPYAAVVSGMWTDGFISGVLYARHENE